MDITKRLKELEEKRGAKLKEANALVTKARDEKRELSAEELGKVEALHNEAENIVKNVSAEARQFALESQRGPSLNDYEKRTVARFDYNKLLRHLVRSAKGVATQIDGVEAEMISEGEKEARSCGVETNGVMLPRILVRSEKRDMTATGTTTTTGDQGGQTIQTSVNGALLDDFFNASVLAQGGATVLEGLVGNLAVPRIVAGTAAAKKTETAAADEVSPTTAFITLQPKRLPAYIDIGEQLLNQSSSVTQQILGSHIRNQMLATQEAAFFHGTGTNEAQGIAGVSGIGSVAGGTNGLAPAWSHIVNLETAVDTSNALLGNLHYVSNGQIRGKLKQTQRVSGTDSRMILDDSGALLNGYQPLWTNAVSRTLSKGTSASVCSAIFFANLADYWIGYWSGISLEVVRDKTNAISGLYTLVASTYYDGNIVRPKSFAAMLDALGA